MRSSQATSFHKPHGPQSQPSLLNEYTRVVNGFDPDSRETIERFQLAQLNDLLGRITSRSTGFYSGLPKHLETLDELGELPFTYPEDIVEHGSELIMVSQSEVARMVTESTSGTTGAPKRIPYTVRDRHRTEQLFEIGLQELIGPGDTVLIGFPPSEPAGLTDLLDEAISAIGAKPLLMRPESDGDLQGQLPANMQETNRYVGLPSFIQTLLDSGARIQMFEEMLLSGDACSQSLVDRIENATGSKPYLHYGMREIGLAGAVDCHCRCGMHVREGDLIVEIVDKGGNPVGPGVEGEIVLTSIGAQAMPLLRYRTGDRGMIVPGECPCGSPLKMLDHDIGRIRTAAIR